MFVKRVRGLQLQLHPEVEFYMDHNQLLEIVGRILELWSQHTCKWVDSRSFLNYGWMRLM